jgi:hypothetical protein
MNRPMNLREGISGSSAVTAQKIQWVYWHWDAVRHFTE